MQVLQESSDSLSLSSKKAWEAPALPGQCLKTVAFLRNGGTLDELCDEFGLRCRRDKELPLVLLKYQQLSAPFWRAITRECRGLVLEEKSWRVVAYPYDKFFNATEPLSLRAPPLDWSSVRCYEKLDGSLATLYHYDGRWLVASSGTPTGDGLLNDTETFAQIFWEIWKKEGYSLPKDTSMNYIFEMISKKNPIVVIPTEDEVILHGARSLKNNEEVWPEPVAKANGWKCVKSYPMKSFEEIEKACRSLNPHVNEGFVVVDSKFQRRKLKSPAYVGLSLLSSRDTSNNESNMLRIVRQNETDEFTSYYPQWAVLCEYVRDRYQKMIRALEQQYREPMQDAHGTVAVLFRKMKEKKISKKAEVERSLCELYSELDMKEASDLLDVYAPENQDKKTNMLRRQQMLFDQLGIDSSKKKKKKKRNKNKNKNNADEGGLLPPATFVISEPPSVAKQGWEVVDKKKKKKLSEKKKKRRICSFSHKSKGEGRH